MTTDFVPDLESNEVLKELHHIDWSLTPEEVGKTLLNNYKVLQSRLPATDSKEKHGILSIKSSRFDNVLIADETLFQVNIESTESTFAIPMTAEIAIVSVTNPDTAVIFAVAPDKDDEKTYGSRVVVLKSGTGLSLDKRFISTKIVDRDKFETAQNLRRKNMRFNSNLEDLFSIDNEINRLTAEAVATVEKDYESISPTMDSYCDIKVELPGLSFTVLGIDNGFVIIKSDKPFQVQAFRNNK